MDQTYKIKIRLFCRELLELDKLIFLNLKETHYLKNVMRCKIDDKIYLFNEKHGEFESKIINLKKKLFVLKILKKSQRDLDKLYYSKGN